MEVWRTDVIEGKRPEVLSGRNLVTALVLHVLVFATLLVIAAVHGLFKPKETVIPIDLTVIVNENLDGKEDEPPPLANPPPPQPKPKPKPKPKPVAKKPDPPKALEQIVTNNVQKVEKKEEKKPDEEKKPKDPPKKDEPPKKTAKELREERIRKMRESATKNKKPVKIEVKDVPSGNGKTAKQTMSQDEIQKLLNMGYRPGTSNQIAAGVMQLGVSLVQRALNEKWDAMGPKVGANGTVLLSCRFNSSGGLVNVQIVQGCGDRMSDAAALSVARNVTFIRNLPAEFRERFSKETLTIRYQVRGK